MDGVEIGDDCLVAAAALVAPGTKIPSGQLVMGAPARVVRPLRPDEIESLKQSAQHYVEHAASYRTLGIL
jgi:carbonic anhydrase/acetyltransferase-like protein (isoleucine patch superfamily)